MEKKSFAIGGAIGTAVGMVAMLGIALGVGSCANKDKVKNVQEKLVFVQRPKMEAHDEKEVYKCTPKASLLGTAYDGSSYQGGRVKGCLYTVNQGNRYGWGTVTSVFDTIPSSISAATPLVIGIYQLNFDNSPMYNNAIGNGSVGADSNNQWAVNTGGGDPNFVALPIYLDSTVYAESTESGVAYMEHCYDMVLGTASIDGSSILFEAYPEPEPTPSGGLVSDIFNQVTASITNFAQALGNSVTEGVKLFYVDGNWTPLGILTLVSAGIALVYWCFYLIKKLLNIGVK